ncbi:MAG: glycosyltransferase [Candidatus Acidiferrales bacterium]
MIFVTVGTSLPFDRLVGAVDEWAGAHSRTDVFAQIGRSEYRPKHIEAVRFLDPPEFRRRIQLAAVVVAHAGMGAIITALEIGKPIVVMPRRAHLRETRSDHQVATAEQFQQRGILVALNEQELLLKLDHIEMVSAVNQVKPQASQLLISTVRSFIGGIGTAKYRKPQ